MKNIFAWLGVQLEWLKSFFSEDNGKGSHKRFVGTAVVAAFLFSYVKTTLNTNKLEDIPVDWMFLIIGIIGLNIYDWYIKLKNGNKE